MIDKVVIQQTACKARGLHQEFKSLPKCHLCASGAKNKCLFIGCRRLLYSEQAATPYVLFEYEDVIDPHFLTVYNRPITPEVARQKMIACASVLLPLLLKEKAHVDRLDVIRKQEIQWRAICNICITGLFSESWLCSACGRELCNACKVTLSESESYAASCSSSWKHLESNLRPLSRFLDYELHDAIKAMESILRENSSEILTPLRNAKTDTDIGIDQQPNQSSITREAPALSLLTFSITDFHQYWAQGIPVVVTDVDSRLQGQWDPAYFISRYGNRKVTIQDCESQKTRQSNVAQFFSDFGSSRQRTKIEKLKDWPPQHDFRKDFPELFCAFESAVPHPDMARLDGISNLAAHFPQNAISPDLGPKMYNAHETADDDQHHGSTFLHGDLTDAVNIMAWAGVQKSGGVGFALWHIFPAKASQLLRKFLREEGFQGPGDPIHSQWVYLTRTTLERLMVKYNVRPYVIYQRPGMAVYIPAGCAHQVANMSDAIKIACDFISIDNLARTEQLVEEFRQHRLATGAGDDVLQLYITLWYAWVYLSQLYPSFTADVNSTGPSSDTTSTMDSTPHITNDTVEPSYGMLGIDPPGNSLPSDPHIIALDTISPIVIDTEPSISGRQILSAPDSKKLRKKLKNLARRAKAFEERPSNPAHHLTCLLPRPECTRKYNRNGLIDHLKTKHDDIFVIDEETETRIRATSKVTELQCLQQLQLILDNASPGLQPAHSATCAIPSSSLNLFTG